MAPRGVLMLDADDPKEHKRMLTSIAQAIEGRRLRKNGVAADATIKGNRIIEENIDIDEICADMDLAQKTSPEELKELKKQLQQLLDYETRHL